MSWTASSSIAASQILLTAYPEVQGRLDVAALEVGLFEPGAAIRRRGRFHRVSDPLRRPLGIPGTVSAPIGTLADKVRLVRLVLDVRRHTVGELLRRPDTTTAERLARAGFSDRMMESFWQPLFAGIQLDPDLEVSSRRFDTILRMLAVGATGVPRHGMGMIPAQLASTLPDHVVRLGASVVQHRPLGRGARRGRARQRPSGGGGHRRAGGPSVARRPCPRSRFASGGVLLVRDPRDTVAGSTAHPGWGVERPGQERGGDERGVSRRTRRPAVRSWRPRCRVLPRWPQPSSAGCVSSSLAGSIRARPTGSTCGPTSSRMASRRKGRHSTPSSRLRWARGCSCAATIVTPHRSRGRCSAVAAPRRPCWSTFAVLPGRKGRRSAAISGRLVWFRTSRPWRGSCGW